VRFAALALAALVIIGIGACGGSDPGSEAGQGGEAPEGGEAGKAGEPGRAECERLGSESAREDCERAEAAAHVPAADRVAYYQLATTTGLLRAASVATARGDPRPPKAGGVELAAARDRVAKSRPRDGDLRAVRRRLLDLLASGGRESSRRSARRALAALRGIERGLASYLRREPANASLLPD